MSVDMSRKLIFRKPTAHDGKALHELVRQCAPLDENSLYCNLLQCHIWSDTAIVAVSDEQIIGAVTGFRKPDDSGTIFIWQVAVCPSHRGAGLGQQMLLRLVERLGRSLNMIETTISPGNTASEHTFSKLGAVCGVDTTTHVLFDSATHFDGHHPSEVLWRIGPFQATEKQSMSIFDDLESNVRSYSRSFPVTFVRAKDARLFTDQGESYIDFLAGAGALNYGHNPSALKTALLDYIQLDGVTHGLDMQTHAKGEFLNALDTLILKPRGMNYRVQFTGPTGTNAVEAAMKLARKVKGRETIVSFTNGFHGVSLGALSATGNQHHRGGAGISMPGIVRMPYDGYLGDEIDSTAYFEKMLTDPSSGLDHPAAVMVETIQGEGGATAASLDWLKRLEAICRSHDMLLIVDDIQAGCGRSGTFFSFEDADISPDLITLSKSLSGYGSPLSIVLFKPELDHWSPGEHNGTFRGNNLAFVTATEAFRQYWSDDQLMQDVQRKAHLVQRELMTLCTEFEDFGLSHRGRGLMQGLYCGTGELAGQIAKQCFDHGLIIETSGPNDEVLKVLCPLTISEADLSEGLRILADAVRFTCHRTEPEVTEDDYFEGLRLVS